MEDQIVGAVQALALVLGGQGRPRSVFPPRHLSIAVLAGDETTLGIEGEPIGARLGAREGGRAVIAARFQELGCALGRLPFVDDVVRDVREEQEPALLAPDRPFSPPEPFAQFLEDGVGGNQRIERGRLS
jgi:hypothetical protein